VTREEPVPITRLEALEQRHGLLVRVASALALGAVVIGAILIGGWPHSALWCIAAIGVFWEWTRVVAITDAAVRFAGVGVLIVIALLSTIGLFLGALAVFLAGLAAAYLLTRPGIRVWGAAGLAYAAPVLIGPVLLRADSQFGAQAVIFLCGVVWSTDTLAYFTGRLCGGPKLARRLSPKKTWSGAVGGITGGMAASAALAAAFAPANMFALVCLGLLLSVVSQAGDLLESGIKRHFGVKDSSHLIPGHGGLMDRLDGFLLAAGVAAFLGFARGGTEHAAVGLLQW
jgi:phosphatidate cytidylyltransferase